MGLNWFVGPEARLDQDGYLQSIIKQHNSLIMKDRDQSQVSSATCQSQRAGAKPLMGDEPRDQKGLIRNVQGRQWRSTIKDIDCKGQKQNMPFFGVSHMTRARYGVQLPPE